MSSAAALHLYRQLTQAGEDEVRAHILAEAFAELEDRYPNLKDIATQGHVRESELRLQKEIKEVEGRLQKEIKEVEFRLQKEIKEVEGRLQKEIREIDARLQKEIETVRLEVKNVEVRLTQAIHRHTLWVIGAVGSIIGIIRLLDWFLAHLPATP
jgi:predicted phage-related endonuclease